MKRTNTPYRVKPFNIYYHMYSGSKQASLNAILSNLDLAEASDIAPVTTSTFALIAQGFYTTRIVDMGDRRWRIENRGKLQTLRFDHATFTSVDFSRSKGVIGQYNHQGSLYVDLTRPILSRSSPFTIWYSPTAANRLTSRTAPKPMAGVRTCLDRAWMEPDRRRFWTGGDGLADDARLL